MFEAIVVSKSANKEEKYMSLLPQIEALLHGESDLIANLANCMAALKYGMNYFWVGVYFVKQSDEKEELVLGPFQGTLACTRIAKGKGVCGKSWESKETIIVEDVEKFPGHIACSSESKSEIVLPALNKQGNVVLVLDVDSDKLNDFDAIDKKYLSQVIQLIEKLY
jgi:L-methionine (R)-S-oxide reductase